MSGARRSSAAWARARDALQARRDSRARPAVGRGGPSPRQGAPWPLVGALGAALLASLAAHCAPAAPTPPAPACPPCAAAPAETGGGGEGGAAARRPGPARARWAVTGVGRPPWLDALELQIGARAPALAACVTGASAGGALRWTATVDPASGRVADAAVEAAGGASLGPDAAACLRAGLGAPYALGGRGEPARVDVRVEY